MDHQKYYQEAVKALTQVIGRRPWREAVVENMIRVGLRPSDALELRITNCEERDPFALVQHGLNAFLSAFNPCCTTIVAHPAIAQLLSMDGHAFKARHTDDDKQFIRTIMGEGFTPHLLSIETDSHLDLDVIAIRFSVDFDDYQEAVIAVARRTMKREKGGHP